MQYPGDPLNRVQQDVDEVLSLISNLKTEGMPEKMNRRLGNQAAVQLAAMLLEPENHQKEMSAFMYAWKGSIEFQTDEVSRGLADVALSLEDFFKVFSFFEPSCDLPQGSQENPA